MRLTNQMGENIAKERKLRRDMIIHIRKGMASKERDREEERMSERRGEECEMYIKKKVID